MENNASIEEQLKEFSLWLRNNYTTMEMWENNVLEPPIWRDWRYPYEEKNIDELIKIYLR